MNLFEEHFSMTIFRLTINNACASGARDSTVSTAKTYSLYKSTIAISFNPVTAFGIRQ